MLKIEYLPLADLKPYVNNAKLHPAEQVEQIKRSITEFGFDDPIAVWGDNTVIEGHGRLIAANELGLETVPVIRLDHLTDEQRKAYALVHNKLTMNSDFDVDTLAQELDGILDIDMSDFGFDFLDEEEEPTEVTEVETPARAEPRCKVGDLWQLGGHRLICGDSTNPDTFARLMGGVRADIAITSPPYNTGHMDVAASEERGGQYDPSTGRKYLHDDDTRTDNEYREFLHSNVGLLIDNAEEVFYNMGVVAGSKTAIIDLLYAYRDNVKDLLYWEKTNQFPLIIESVIASSIELIIAFGKNNTRAFRNFNDRSFHGLISGINASGNEYSAIHKATFPVYLPAAIIERFTAENGTVLDCFGGTGTTMIACEQLNRVCYMAELEPAYCDVIIERWENFTGNKAVLLNAE